MSFHNLFADGQSDAGAGIFLPAVEPLEDDEDALGVLRGNADAVVPYGENPPVALSAGRDVNAGGGSLPRNLIAFPTRFWNNCPNCERSTITVGRGSWVTTAPFSSMATFRSLKD